MRQAAITADETVEDHEVEIRLPNAEKELEISPTLEPIATRTTADRVRTFALGALADTFRDF